MRAVNSSLVFLLILCSLVFVTPAFAHVIVEPKTVGVGEDQTFTINVPTEGDAPTISVRVLIPNGLQEVTPNVKPGWNVAIKKEGEGESAKVTEIEWSGGSIPTGERDVFVFSAQAPLKPVQLVWKAYQTLSSGLIIAWDKDPNGLALASSDSAQEVTPYSVTTVANDLIVSPKPTVGGENKISETLPLALSVMALVLAAVAVRKTCFVR